MKKTITIYDLITLIKEGKAPEKAIYSDYVYSFNEENQDYYNINLDEYLIYQINSDGNNWLDVEIEIFEEKENDDNFTGMKMYAYGKEFMSIDYSNKEEFEGIEEINYYPVRKNEIAVDYIENNETKHFCLNKKEKYFSDKINQLIKNQKKIIERLKKNGN